MPIIGNHIIGTSSGSHPFFTWALKLPAHTYTATGPDTVSEVHWYGGSQTFGVRVRIEIWEYSTGLPTIRVNGPHTIILPPFAPLGVHDLTIPTFTLTQGTTYAISFFSCAFGWASAFTIVASSLSVEQVCPSVSPWVEDSNSFRQYTFWADVVQVTPQTIIYPCCAQLI